MSDQVEQLDRLRTALADRYRIERRLGEGGMATVYLAEDLKHHWLIARGTETSSYPQFPIPWHNPQEDRYEANDRPGCGRQVQRAVHRRRSGRVGSET